VFGRLLTIAILVAAGYWYWSGPFQQQRNPNYKAGATGIGEGNPEEICAEKFNLYYYEGEWRHNSDG